MKTTYILVGAAGAAALFLCYRAGRRQHFTGIDALRAGAASAIDKVGDIVSPTCCTGCQAAAGGGALPLGQGPTPTPPPGTVGTDPSGTALGTDNGDQQQIQLSCGST